MGHPGAPAEPQHPQTQRASPLAGGHATARTGWAATQSAAQSPAPGCRRPPPSRAPAGWPGTAAAGAHAAGRQVTAGGGGWRAGAWAWLSAGSAPMSRDHARPRAARGGRRREAEDGRRGCSGVRLGPPAPLHWHARHAGTLVGRPRAAPRTWCAISDLLRRRRLPWCTRGPPTGGRAPPALMAGLCCWLPAPLRAPSPPRLPTSTFPARLGLDLLSVRVGAAVTTIHRPPPAGLRLADRRQQAPGRTRVCEQQCGCRNGRPGGSRALVAPPANAPNLTTGPPCKGRGCLPSP